MNASEDQLLQLFDACDANRQGWLTIDDLARICSDLPADELQYVFEQLDRKGTGRVTRDDFRVGFLQAVNAGEDHGFPSLRRRGSIAPVYHSASTYSRQPSRDSTSSVNSLGSISENTYSHSPVSRRKLIPTTTEVIEEETFKPAKIDSAIPCQDDVLALYAQLQTTGVPEILGQFEKVIGGIVKELKDQQEQNAMLQNIYRKEKDEYSKQMSEVESEVDHQIALAEARARQEERERVEQEKQELRRTMESEIVELQSNIKRLQKMETAITDSNERSQKVTEFKYKLSEIANENRNLKTNLAEAQTSVALAKAEIAQLRQEYEEKCDDLVAEKEHLMAELSEKDNLDAHMRLLQDANKRLHDTNDSLRSNLENRQAMCKRFNIRSPSPAPQEYYDEQEDSLGPFSSSSFTRPNQLQLHRGSVMSNYSKEFTDTDDADSGLVITTGSEMDFTPIKGSPVPHYDSDSMPETPPETRPSLPVKKTRKTSVSKPKRRTAKKSGERQSSIEATGPPERTFRVVMAGDASVGKSSVITRLCKGHFDAGLPSTLGVDFHVRNINVDGTNVAIQLWDTAGQERFRSLCKSYFRRADGAFMVYDCTCEHSFLNVRNWLSVIRESTTRQIPILIMSNKIDLRDGMFAEGKNVITTEDGKKFARNYGDVLFLETSAKDGTNINFAILELARELLAQEDCEIKGQSVVLKKNAEKKSGACCTKS